MTHLLGFPILVPPPSRPEFQWYLNDKAIEGADDSSYSCLAFDQTHEGNYSVEVRTPAGVDRRIDAVVVIKIQPPQITNQPERLGLAPGAPFSIHVKASGSKPLFYQWYHNDEPINAATSDTYQIKAATESAIGTYTVEVRNRFGNITSKPIVVSFDPTFMNDWRGIKRSSLDTSNSPFYKSGDFYWNTLSRLQTRDFLEWMPMNSRIANIPVFADGTYWSADSNSRLIMSNDGIEWLDANGVAFEQYGEMQPAMACCWYSKVGHPTRRAIAYVTTNALPLKP